MAKGWDAVQEQSAALAEQREQFGKSFKPMLTVNPKNMGPYTIRFLEQGPDVNSFATHEYKIPNPSAPGGVSVRRFTCLNDKGDGTPCPGCQSGMKRKVRGVYNVIQRNRPQLRKGADNKAIQVNGQYIVDGYQDEVVIASVGGPTAEMLRKTDGNYHGLMSRDFLVQYSGDTFQAWTLSPVLDAAGNANATPMSENDQRLAMAKHNLDEVMAPPTFQEAAQIVAKYGSGVPQGSPGAPPPQATQHGVGVGQQGANGFLAGAAVPPGALPNTFGGVVPPGVPQPQPPQPAQPVAPPPVPQPPAPQPVQAQPPAQPQPVPVPQPAPVQQ